MRRLLTYITILSAALAQTLSAQWVSQTSGTPAMLKDVVMLDSLTAIAVGNWGTILKTTNAGTTWFSRPGGGYNWNAVAFANPLQGIVVGEGHTTRITTNAGDTWIPLTPPGSGDLIAASMVDNHVIIGTSSGQIVYSTDLGVTWSVSSLGQFPYDLFFVRGNFVSYTGYVVCARTVLKTTNHGDSWSTQQLPITGSGLALSGARSPDGFVFIVGFDGNAPVILRQTTSDTAWQAFDFGPSPPNAFLTDVAAPGLQIAYACGSGGRTYKTDDGGISWDLIPTSTSYDLRGVHFINERRGFAVGDMGTILFTSNGGVITEVRGEEPLPSKFELLQNYPNPFNPSTKMVYRVKSPASAGRPEFISLKVFDVLGREVATLVNEVQSFGTHSVEFFPSGLSSGVYFYQLKTTEGNLTKRMLLVK